jgi:membrane protein DedA with SNARE-associated domain
MSTESLLGLFAVYGYAIVFVAILLDNAGLPIPGELLLLAFGGLARGGELDLFTGVAVATAAALMGDSAAYWGGRCGCHYFLPARVAQERLSPRPLTVVLGRFVVGARLFFAPLAGCSRMAFARFLLMDGLGCLLWAGAFILIGYLAGDHLISAFERGRGLIALAVAGLGATWLILILTRTWRARRA